MIKPLDPKNLKAFLESKPRVLITMHRGPDGDAIGSALGWRHILKHFGIDADVVSPDGYPDNLHWLPDDQVVVNFERQPERAESIVKEADVVFCLDFNAPARLGNFADLVTQSGNRIIVIDHHRFPQPFADEYYVDDGASSTSEMICRLALDMGAEEAIDRKAALCLYTGIVTDTGSFRFSSVTPDVLRMAAKLLETGMDHTRVYSEIFDSHTLMRQKLIGYALSQKLVVVPGTSAAYISLSEEELNRYESKKGDTEGLVNEALSIRGVSFAAFFYERDGAVKVSLRSKGKFDVQVIASRYFNGGGHVNASGGTSRLSLEESCLKFEEIAREYAALKTETP